jgi:hypothetical protein
MKLLFLFAVSVLLSFGSEFNARAQDKDNPFAGAPTQYSVDVVTTRKKGTALSMHMYVDGSKRRTEQETNNGKLVLILRGDIDMMYTILVNRKAYRSRAADPTLVKSLDAYGFANGTLLSRDKVGTETIKGQVCDKYRFSAATENTGDSEANKSAGSGFIWISETTHFPVMSKINDTTTEWENLEVGPQDPSLFLPPADFQSAD